MKMAAAILLSLSLLLAGCGDSESVTPERYKQSDALFNRVGLNVMTSDSLEKIIEIDHSRMGFGKSRLGHASGKSYFIFKSGSGSPAEIYNQLTRNRFIHLADNLRE